MSDERDELEGDYRGAEFVSAELTKKERQERADQEQEERNKRWNSPNNPHLWSGEKDPEDIADFESKFFGEDEDEEDDDSAETDE